VFKIRNQNLLVNHSIPISDNHEFQSFIELAKLPSVKVLHVDTESTYTPTQNIKDGTGFTVGTSIDYELDSDGPAFSYYFPFRHKVKSLDHTYLAQIKNLLEKGKKKIVCHNVKHDILALQSLGIDISECDFECTMLMAHQANENKLSYRLDTLAKELGLPGKARDKIFDLAVKLVGWDGMPPNELGEYACTDASLLRPLRKHWLPIYQREDDSNGECWAVDKQFILCLNDIETTGAKVDLELAAREYERGTARMAEVVKDIGLNPGSRDELEKLLIGELELPVVKRSPKTNKPSFDKKAMEQYDQLLEESHSPVAQLVLEYRGYQKATSSYWKSYLEHVSPDGRLRPNFNMHRTVTHRLSCDTPNLQQIPRISSKPWHGNVKQGIIPEEGYVLIGFDYKQLELRLGAAYGKEQRLISILNDPERDIFSEMSLDLNMLRDDTKTLNYSLQYGAGIRRVSTAFGVPANTAKSIRDNYFNTYPGLRDATNLAARVCKNKGYVKTWASRRRHFTDKYQEAHKAFNAVIQGGGFEIVKRQMVKIRKELGPNNLDCRMILQVHDEVLFEIKKEKVEYYCRIIKKIMEDVVPDFGVQFHVSVKQWGT